MQTEPPKTSAHGSGDQLGYITATRGAALLYVVLDHSVDLSRAPSYSGWDVVLKLYRYVDSATDQTRMGTLFFLTGLFLERSMARGTMAFVRGRARTLLWPLLLWTLVQAGVFLLLPAVATWRGTDDALALLWSGLTDAHPASIARAWVLLSGQFWFLDFLLVYLVLFMAVRRLPALAGLSIAIACFAVGVFAPPPAAHTNPALSLLIVLGPYFLFFWLGIALSDWAVRRRAELTTRQAILCGALFAALTVLKLVTGRETAAWLGALVAIPLALNLGKWLTRTSLRFVVLWAGQASLLILCLHFMFIGALRAVMIDAGVTSRVSIVVLAACGALAMCFAADWIVQRAGWSPALGLGVRRKRRAGALFPA